MQWTEEAKKAQEMLPIPPIMIPYAKLQSEKIARNRGLDRVTLDVVKETEKVYEEFLGKEKTEELRAYIKGEGPPPKMEEELFFEKEDVLYHIDVCYTKYGENTQVVRDMVKDIFFSIEEIMEKENVTQIMADLCPFALHGASKFTIGITGCPNCCVSPYLKDFGVICQHKVRITDKECIRCENCVRLCFDNAISLKEDGPVIDWSKCMLCELCARDCETGKLVTEKRGYKIIAGGSAGRHPRIAQTVEEMTTKERVIELLKNCITRLRKAKPGETLASILDREGIEAIS